MKKAYKFRSKFEERVWGLVADSGVVEYEPKAHKIPYTINFTYLPDFVIDDGRIIVETKGRLTYEDMRKMLAVKEAFPDKDIRFVFMRAGNRVRRNSPTTYADWADKHGFPWAEGTIPKEWLENA